MKRLLAFLGSTNMFGALAITTSFVISCGVEITLPPQPKNLQDCLDYKNSVQELSYELNSKRKLVEKDVQEKLKANKITQEEANNILKDNKSVQNALKMEQNIYAMNVQESYYRKDETWILNYYFYVDIISTTDLAISSDSTKEHIQQLIGWLNEGLDIKAI